MIKEKQREGQIFYIIFLNKMIKKKQNFELKLFKFFIV